MRTSDSETLSDEFKEQMLHQKTLDMYERFGWSISNTCQDVLTIIISQEDNTDEHDH